APLIDEVVISDPEQPGVEVASAPKFSEVGESLEQRLLGQVLGAVPVMRQMVEPAVEPLPVALDQHGEGLSIALLGAVYEQVLFIREHIQLIEGGHCLPPCLAGQAAGKLARACMCPVVADCNAPFPKLLPKPV